MTTDPLPTTHVLSHAAEALTSDDRVGELGLTVAEEGLGEAAGDGTAAPSDVATVVVRGAVSTTERKAGVLPVVKEVLQSYGVDREVRDETVVAEAKVPDGEAEEV